MKLKNYLLLFPSALLIGCSSDDPSDNTNPGDALFLEKTVTYEPSRDAYTNNEEYSWKTVTYYEDNRIVADTLYGPEEKKLWTIIEYANTSKTATTFNAIGSPGIIYQYTYDQNGRITAISTTQNGVVTGQRYISYSPGTITIQSTNPVTGETFEHIEQLGANGLISGNMSYDGNKPLEHSYPGVIGSIVYSFYDIPMPANLLKSVDELNNAILEYGIKEFGEHCNYHLKVGTEAHEKTFNNAGYVTYDKIVDAPDVPRYRETFYYYNK